MPFIVPFLPYIAAGLGAVGGGLSATKGARTQTQTQDYSGTSTPVMGPEWSGIFNQLLDFNKSRMGSDVDLSGYETAGIGGINKTYDTINRAISNDLSARGLSSSPIAGSADVRSQIARGGDIGTFRGTLPLVQRGFEQENYQNLLNLFGKVPVGQKTTGTSSGQVTYPGSVAGSVFGGMGDILAFLMGKGVLGGGKTTGGSSGSASYGWG